MERWKIAKCSSKGETQYYLCNRQRTPIRVSKRLKHFNILEFISCLNKVSFPMRFLNNIQHIHFTILPDLYGYYMDDEVWVDVRKRRRMKMIVETFVHEIAHHVDLELSYTPNNKLRKERKKKGHLIHSIAKKSDEEYFARGFEKFYSTNPRDKIELKKFNPALYYAVNRLHTKYKHK